MVKEKNEIEYLCMHNNVLLLSQMLTKMNISSLSYS